MTFYIGSLSGSGVKCSTKEEFFRYLTGYIETVEENGEEEFGITIDTVIYYNNDED